MEPGVYWRDNKKPWKPYKQEVAQKILDKYFEVLGLHGNCIDFSTMELTNACTRADRIVKIVLVPVEDLLLQLIDAKFLERVITCPGVTMQIQPNKLDSSSAIYRKFVGALQRYATLDDNSVLDEMRQAVRTCSISDLKSLEFVFHGSPLENISSILEQGLDPLKARDDFLWVGKDPLVSRPYCRSSRKTMVLFLELKNHGESDWCFRGKRTVPLDKSHVLLPVAKLVCKFPEAMVPVLRVFQ